MIRRNALALVVVVLAVSGCRCGGQTARKFPDIQVTETLVDFGTVQTDVEHVRELRVYNGGAADLSLTEFRVAEPFGVKDVPTVVVPPGEEVALQLTFKPTEADKRLSETLTIVSNDPDQGELEVQLVGAGITATATADPNPIEFGDVYVNETKTVKVTIHNGGSNELVIQKKEFLAETPPDVSAQTDLSQIPDSIAAGASVTFDATFKPSDMSESIPGGIKLTLDPLQGGELVMTFAGRGVRAIPRLCFKFEDSPMEQCTARDATTGPSANLPIIFPPLCDSLVSPPDAGSTETTCAGAPYEMSGTFYIRNEGNLPVKYSMQFKPDVEKSCDGGVPERIDFQFSNAPSPDSISYNEPTVQLPAMPGDPKPWETAGIRVTYRATAACPDEAADQAQVLWTRQGDSRQPVVLSAFFAGQSRLPAAVPADTSITGKPHSIAPIYGAENQGIAEFEITNVELWEVVTPEVGGACDGPDAGLFQPCDFNNPVSDCYQWSFADGGDPNLTAPHTIPIASDGGLGRKEIGRLEFTANESANLNQPYCVYSVATTTDPFHPTIISRIKGIRVQE
ncbi:MAG: choice-of-anchor D domain-containing protein [Myxococcaceae bacterium]|nr:choice-of-anchor D domain-containing protein [Myxococcaceae bacterium]